MVQGRVEGAETGRVPERLKALREAEARAAVEIRQAADSLDEVLEPLQQARWRVLEEQMERQKARSADAGAAEQPGSRAALTRRSRMPAVDCLPTAMICSRRRFSS